MAWERWSKLCLTSMSTRSPRALLIFSDDVYQSLKRCLLDRARDKEAVVRVQAALGLAKLSSGEDEEELEEGEESLAEVLLDLLRYDPAA